MLIIGDPAYHPDYGTVVIIDIDVAEDTARVAIHGGRQVNVVFSELQEVRGAKKS